MAGTETMVAEAEVEAAGEEDVSACSGRTSHYARALWKRMHYGQPFIAAEGTAAEDFLPVELLPEEVAQGMIEDSQPICFKDSIIEISAVDEGESDGGILKLENN